VKKKKENLQAKSPYPLPSETGRGSQRLAKGQAERQAKEETPQEKRNKKVQRLGWTFVTSLAEY
jgi:hypothetical protein